jgi:hypothetical protein
MPLGSGHMALWSDSQLGAWRCWWSTHHHRPPASNGPIASATPDVKGLLKLWKPKKRTADAVADAREGPPRDGGKPEIDEGFLQALNDILDDAIMDRIDPARRSLELGKRLLNIVSSPDPDREHDSQASPQGWQVHRPQALFATPKAKQTAGVNLSAWNRPFNKRHTLNLSFPNPIP